MSSHQTAAKGAVAAPARTSTRVTFFMIGFGMAAWAPLVPYAKARLGVDEGALGLLLLCLGAGSCMTMPFSGALAARFGCRRLITVAALGLLLSLPLLAALSSPILLGVALLLFGASVGSIDVAVNIQAVMVEAATRRALMSGFHGLFSVGGIVGAGFVSALLWLGASPLSAALCADAVIGVALLSAWPHLLREGDGGSTAFAVPHGLVLLIGALCFISFLTEGAMLDWSAVFLAAWRDLAPAQSGLGYAVFSVTMTIGRLTGDRVVRHLGGRTVLAGGAVCAASGLVVATLVPSAAASLAGFALVGLGASNIVPVLFSALGRQRVMQPSLAASAASTMGYFGILLGPALIGFGARAASLPVALLAVAALLLVVAVNARVVAGR